MHKKVKIYIKEDQIKGGKGDFTTPEDVDSKEFEVGVKVEMEHTEDEDKAKEIALDHLTEDPQYYSQMHNCGLIDEPEANELARKYWR